jgi:uncharacterized protein (TIGR02145 family)
LGGESVAGGKLKANTLWLNPNTGADNSSGFTALPGGYLKCGGSFLFVGCYGYWWSATEASTHGAWYRNMHYYLNTVYRNYTLKEMGFSVRCVRD